MPLVEYDSNSSDEEAEKSATLFSKKTTSSIAIAGAGAGAGINPAPAVQQEMLFAKLPSNSSKEITRNLPLSELSKPIQGGP